MLFLLLWYNVFVYWKLKLLNFLMDAILNIIELYISPKNWSTG